MNLDIQTLAVALSLVFLTQVVALGVQHRINKRYRGPGWWLAGTVLMALALVFMPLMRVRSLAILARIANPMLVLGHVFIYVGILRFFDRDVKPRILAGLFGVFLVAYYYYMFWANGIPGRTAVVSAAVAVAALMSAYELLFAKTAGIAMAANLAAGALGAYGAFFAVRTVLTLLLPPVQSYAGMPPVYTLGFVIPMVASILWTFGCILMVNQRLNAEDLEEKATLERAFAERKLAEEALRESEATYRSILNASPDDITITDLAGRILLNSPAAERMFGYLPGAAKGMALLDFVLPEDRERAQANILRMHQGTATGTNDYRAVRKDGAILEIEVNSGLIHGPQGQAAKMVFVVRDITGRKQLEAEKAELESRNRQLQKAESLGRMAGAIAHTFNNQMQVVLGSLEVVDALPPGPEVGLALGRVKQAAERAAEVSRLMLVYLGQTSREQEPQSLAGLCRAAESGLRATLAEGVALELDCPGPGPVISANAEQIGQVLASLVANAREALGDARGAIRISLRTDLAADLPTAHRFPVKWQPQGPAYATLEVADTGSGIAAEDLEKLFDPFFSTRFTGRGLGLSVVLGLVQAHGGAVSVASRPGAGSVFRVHLPVLEVHGIG